MKERRPPRVTRGPEAAHVVCGKLHLESFSADESRFLAKYLGKTQFPMFAGAGQQAAVDFAIAWAVEFMSDGEIKTMKRLLAEMHPGPPAVAKAEPKTKKKKAKAFSIADLPVSEKAQDALRDAGLLTPDDILSEGVDGLIELPSVGRKTAQKILDALEG